jgi:NAD(P)-dependent dehydrogenase (short-subunit alcohol dehydrogenase family)
MNRVLITGANKGIGYNIVRQLLADGYAVTALDLETDNLDELAKDHTNLLPIRCDVRDEAAMADAARLSVQTFGGIDIAVHNACRCAFDPMEETDMSVYRDIFDVNFCGALRLVRLVAPYMAKTGGGRIIFTSSGVGVMGFTNISAYASSKGAIESLAKCMNLEYGRQGITFHIFHPPLTRTDSSAGLPVPPEFMADPVKVGAGLARHIRKNRFIICHSFAQKLQTMACYLFPVRMGRLVNKLFQNGKVSPAKQSAGQPFG